MKKYKIYIGLYIIISFLTLGILNLIMYIDGITPKEHIKFAKEFFN